ncbi:uncharacterized protein DSM5745_04212 [Aspergillus mulundensis]|uniref:Uncharacterized protein n=1 Tax=Aspergillus mulundensis TaxID=1810919 RepID=A0A3D8SC29_9EURO|nr:hypothetical protein DSM5745_04212 [Aspergillus mulundensis]RDW83886.1 hypothetical protein DSM5745_04212 [Aspergillus mulundensis]
MSCRLSLAGNLLKTPSGPQQGIAAMRYIPASYLNSSTTLSTSSHRLKLLLLYISETSTPEPSAPRTMPVFDVFDVLAGQLHRADHKPSAEFRREARERVSHYNTIQFESVKIKHVVERGRRAPGPGTVGLLSDGNNKIVYRQSIGTLSSPAASLVSPPAASHEITPPLASFNTRAFSIRSGLPDHAAAFVPKVYRDKSVVSQYPHAAALMRIVESLEGHLQTTQAPIDRAMCLN